MANPTEPARAAWTSTLWPLITGLAVGFLVGRETAGHRATETAGTEEAAPAKSADKAAAANLPAKVYKSQSEFPEGWTKEADLTSVKTVSFDGLSDAQKVTALQALNERNC